VSWGKKYLLARIMSIIPHRNIGGSYGGLYDISRLMFSARRIQTGVDLFGVANWLRTLKEIPPYWESFKKALYDEIGDPTTADT